MSKGKLILGVAIIVILAVATVIGAKVAGKKETIYQVDVTEIQPRLFASTVSASGAVESIDNREVRASVTGKVAKVLVKEGDQIARGAQVGTMDDSDLRDQVQQAKALLTSAEAALSQLRRGVQRGGVDADLDVRKAESRVRQAQLDLEEAKTNAARLERLYAGGAVPRRQVEEARTGVVKAQSYVEEAGLLLEQAKDAAKAKAEELVAAEARAAQARSALRLAEKQLGDAKILSPFAGTVIAKVVEDGAYVTTGTTIVKVADVRKVVIKSKVDEADIGRLQAGQEVEVTADALLDRKVSGKVARIAPQAVVENNAVKFEVEIDVQNDQGLLRPGMSTDVEIVTYRKPGALVVPVQAVVERPEGAEEPEKAEKKAGFSWGKKAAPATAQPLADAKQVKVVYLVRDGKAARVAVETGESDFSDVEILKGVKAGDKVVTGNYQTLKKLRNGNKVKATEGSGGFKE